jgi:hypothetical protein
VDEHKSTPAQPTTDETIEAHYACLERLEQRYRHELLGDEERQELRDRVLALRRRRGVRRA